VGQELLGWMSYLDPRTEEVNIPYPSWQEAENQARVPLALGLSEWMQTDHDLMQENASLTDLSKGEALAEPKVDIALETAFVLERLVKKTDCGVREVCCEEGKGPVVNLAREVLGTMMTKVACVNHVRLTTEVA